jgi:hypothetical protein
VRAVAGMLARGCHVWLLQCVLVYMTLPRDTTCRGKKSLMACPEVQQVLDVGATVRTNVSPRE